MKYILTACTDGIIRVFSNNEKRWINEKELEEYNNLCNLASA